VRVIQPWHFQFGFGTIDIIFTSGLIAMLSIYVHKDPELLVLLHPAALFSYLSRFQILRSYCYLE
jgi:hypothetical protein